MARILVVDDSLNARESVRLVLADRASVRAASLDEDVLGLIASERTDLLVLGVEEPLDRPLGLLREVLLADPSIRVLVLAERELLATARRLFDVRVEAVLPKPFDPHALRRRVIEILAGRTRLPTLAESLEQAPDEARAPGVDLNVLLPAALRPYFTRIARGTSHVVIEGEPGTGKSALAQRIHLDSPWRRAPFARLDAWALTDTRLAAALARLAAGAAGREPVATLCIEELALLSPDQQPALRDLAEGIHPPGTPAAVTRLAVRIVATTTEPIADLAARGALQRELREALAVLVLRLPPLRAREVRLAELCDAVLADLGRRQGRAPRRLSPAALDRLHTYLWPGNLRELRTVLARAVALTDGDEVPRDAIHFVDEILPAPGPAFQEAEEPAAPETRERGAEAAGAPGAEPAGERTAEEAGEPGGEPAAAAEGAPPSMELLAQLLAHEVKNPLVAIKTFTQLVREQFDDPEFRDRFHEIVSADVARIDALVEAATAYSQLGTPARVSLDVGALFDDVLKEFERAFHAKRILVLREGLERRARALADPEHLRFAARCLVAKGIDLVAEGGDLQIGFDTVAGAAGEGARLRATLRLAGAGARLGVMAPLGEGAEAMPPNLEIALAREAIRRQGGAIRIDTSDPRAAVITLALPAV